MGMDLNHELSLIETEWEEQLCFLENGVDFFPQVSPDEREEIEAQLIQRLGMWKDIEIMEAIHRRIRACTEYIGSIEGTGEALRIAKQRQGVLRIIEMCLQEISGLMHGKHM